MHPENVVSKRYRQVLQQTHAASPGWGRYGDSWGDVITQYAQELKAQSILDYGCGTGSLKTHLEGVYPDVREYDPGIVGKDAMPQPADLVVATDVLEHIEPQLVYNVVNHLRQLSLKGAFFVIALKKAKQILSDGRNAHLTIMPPEWWLATLRGAGFVIVKHEPRKGLTVWCK